MNENPEHPEYANKNSREGVGQADVTPAPASGHVPATPPNVQGDSHASAQHAEADAHAQAEAVTDSTKPLPRSSDRHSLFMHAGVQLDFMDEPQTVRIRNLSKGGVLVETGLPAHAGDLVLVTLPNIGTVRGRVAWAVEGRFGVAFDDMVDPHLVRRKVTVSHPEKDGYVDLKQRWGRPGFRS